MNNNLNNSNIDQTDKIQLLKNYIYKNFVNIKREPNDFMSLAENEQFFSQFSNYSKFFNNLF